MKKRNKFEALFPNGKLPDVDEFNRSLDAMSEDGRKRLREKIYKISFITWSVLPDYQQDFIEEVIIHDRQAYADFMQQKTVMGHIRYTLRYPTLFIRMLHLIEAVERTAKTSLSRLAMSVVICFNFSEKIKTLSEKISKEKTTPEDVLILSGKTKIKDDYSG